MGRWTRPVAAVGLALGMLLAGAGIAAACETVEGQLSDPVPRFRLVFVGRVVDVERDGHPVAYAPPATAMATMAGPVAPAGDPGAVLLAAAAAGGALFLARPRPAVTRRRRKA